MDLPTVMKLLRHTMRCAYIIRCAYTMRCTYTVRHCECACVRIITFIRYVEVHVTTIVNASACVDYSKCVFMC